VTGPNTGLFQAWQFALSYRRKISAILNEFKDSIPLDGCIRNYDSAYHIIFTNVKTIQQFSPEVARACHERTTLLDWGMD
jgi:hypothetical protein